ncbi:prepilin-type N-terminal cleavage/methylation domain-containing protein [bacterium]|nr:prepilin-type N-terminal cleavage/methylation domain-containing protein [bacterium]
MKARRGFTLIELLIVVAIIAILAAIAVPNFLEAQTRSKVSRTKADFRSVATAIESYSVDHNHYPVPNVDVTWRVGLVPLTTPIAYLSSIPWRDVFRPAEGVLEWEDGTAVGGLEAGSRLYYNYERIDPASGITWADRVATSGYEHFRRGYLMESVGPNQRLAIGSWFAWNAVECQDPGPHEGVNTIYDPTNGTISGGDIMRYGGETPPVDCGAAAIALINGG